MSRPQVFDEKCDECGKVIGEAPYYEGFEVGGKELCDKCLKRISPEKYVRYRYHSSEERFQDIQRQQKEDRKKRILEEDKMIAQIKGIPLEEYIKEKEDK